MTKMTEIEKDGKEVHVPKDEEDHLTGSRPPENSSSKLTSNELIPIKIEVLGEPSITIGDRKFVPPGQRLRLLLTRLALRQGTLSASQIAGDKENAQKAVTDLRGWIKENIEQETLAQRLIPHVARGGSYRLDLNIPDYAVTVDCREVDYILKTLDETLPLSRVDAPTINTHYNTDLAGKAGLSPRRRVEETLHFIPHQLQDIRLLMTSLRDLLPEGWLLDQVGTPLEEADTLAKKISRICTRCHSLIPESKSLQQAKAQSAPVSLPEDPCFPHGPNVIDACFYIDDTIDDRQSSIIEAIQGRRVIPAKYQYDTGHGAKLYHNLCNDYEFVRYQNSLAFITEKMPAILEKLGQETVHTIQSLVSLGVGDGKKDRSVIRNLIWRLGNQEKLHYYPFDIGIVMLASALRYITADPNIRNRLQVKAICADLTKLQRFQRMFSENEGPKIFTLMGNILGNYHDDAQLLLSIRHILNENDFFFLEVRTYSKGDVLEAGGSPELRRQFNFQPLLALGMSYQQSASIYFEEERDHLSRIPGTRTVVARCQTIPIEDENFENAEIAWFHHYDRNHLSLHLEHEAGFKIVEQFQSQDKDLSLFILQRQSNSN